MAIKAFKRREMKFILNREQFDQLMPRLLTRVNPDEYCKNGKDYTIFNIYYDTENNDVVKNSISHPYYKEKLRMRSYVIPSSPDSEVYLELKKKIGGTVNKRRAVMTLKQAEEFVGSGVCPNVSGFMNNQVTREIAYYLIMNPVKPAVFISYHRMAFFGKEDPSLRVTLDFDIRSRRNRLRLEHGPGGTELLEARYLMEVKFNGAMPLWLADCLSELRIFRTSFSKYGRSYQNERLAGIMKNQSDGIRVGMIPLNTKIMQRIYIK